MRQYASMVLLGATLLSASLLAAASGHVMQMIRLELTVAGLASIAAFACFKQLPDHGDGSLAEATPEHDPEGTHGLENLAPFRDRQFRRYMAIFFVFGFSNLFHSGIVPAFFARDLGFG